MENCNICPRNCGVDRFDTMGFCGAPRDPIVAKTLVHMWEEPPISGTRGSGAVFFAGCNLRCVYCQNHKISARTTGKAVTPSRLAEIFFELKGLGVHNINLVTASHFVMGVAEAIEAAKARGFDLPFIYNTGAYEKAETIRRLDGLIDVYLPDIKYFSGEVSGKYSGAEDYFYYASQAVAEMYRQTGKAVFNEDGLITRGIIVRHLVLPGQRRDSMELLGWIAANIPQSHVSLMSQYFPAHRAGEFKELNRRVTTFEYQSVVERFWGLGLKNGFMQDKSSAVTDYVPDF